MKTLDAILSSAARHPDRPACRFPDGEISYGELLRRAEEEAEGLRSGAGPVPFGGERSIPAVVTILACLLSRRPYVPLTPRLPDARRDAIFRILAESVLPADTAYILFTSGSTGEPKGVPISRDNLDAFTAILPRWFADLDGDGPLTVFGAAPFSFDLSAADLFFVLCGGHTLVSPDRADPADAIRLLKSADAAIMTPTHLRLCLMDPDFSPAGCPRLGCVYLCGETLDPAAAAKFLDRFPSPAMILLNAYGPTEATSAVSAVRITREMTRSGDPLPVGEIGNTTADIRIEDGEIVLTGPSVFGGYLGQIPAENGVPHTHRTGDLGSIDGGLLTCRGRADGQFKYKGYRIETGDVEAHLRALPGVRDGVLIPRRTPDGRGILSLTVYVVPEDGWDPDPAAIRASLAARLPDYMVPKSVRFLDRLPVTPNGKTDRKAMERYV